MILKISRKWETLETEKTDKQNSININMTQECSQQKLGFMERGKVHRHSHETRSAFSGCRRKQSAEDGTEPHAKQLLVEMK